MKVVSEKRDISLYTARDEVLLWLGVAIARIGSDRVHDDYQHILGADGSTIGLIPGRTGIHAYDYYRDWHDHLLYRYADGYQAVNEWLRSMLSRHANYATVQVAQQIWDACAQHGGPAWTDDRAPHNGYPHLGAVAHRKRADGIGRPVRFTADRDHKGRLVVTAELFKGGELEWVGWPRTVSLATWLGDTFTGRQRSDEA